MSEALKLQSFFVVILKLQVVIKIEILKKYGHEMVMKKVPD